MSDNIRLVQLIHTEYGRAVAMVQEPSLVIVTGYSSVYEIALAAIAKQEKLTDFVKKKLSEHKLAYDPIYYGQDTWKLLPAFDCPDNPLHCLVAGTGLTHKNSALNRQMMHKSEDQKLTDSMVMYQWGVEDGFPERGSIGVQPEWFYKGNGSVLRAHGETLQVPAFGNDGGEEPEIAGIYVVDQNGKPWRIGFATGNEFSDHVMEKKNYLYLAPSKLRQCSIGPELVLDTEFTDITGTVKVSDANGPVWSSDIKTGEKNMAHSLENLEYHHFKYTGHRIPTQGHVHFFGADAFSFGSNIALKEADIMEVQWNGMGRALQNSLSVSRDLEKIITVSQL